MRPRPTQLLTTRTRIAFALVLTTLVLVQEIRGLFVHDARSAWLLGPPLLQGWTLIAVNTALYAYFCWLAFWCIRRTAGRERFFMLGWFLGLLLWPVKMFWPHSTIPIRHISAFGLLVSLFAALALLLNHSVVDEPSGTTIIG